MSPPFDLDARIATKIDKAGETINCILSLLISDVVLSSLNYVGVPRFELGTPCSQSRCANRAALHPENSFLLNCGAKLQRISHISKHFLFFLSSCVFHTRIQYICTREKNNLQPYV